MSTRQESIFQNLKQTIEDQRKMSTMQQNIFQNFKKIAKDYMK